MNSIYFYCFILFFSFYSCEEMKDYHYYNHENGLAVSVPNGYSDIQMTKAGFLIGKPGNTEIRNPKLIRIELLPNDSIIKSNNWELLEAEIFYRTEKHEGASGGPLYIFQAWKKSKSSLILLEESYQSEFNDSQNFKIGKTIIINSKIDLPNNTGKSNSEMLK